LLFASTAASPPPDREKQFAIRVLDEGGNPVSGASIAYNQMSMDFIFATEWAWWSSYYSLMGNRTEFLDLFNGLGINSWCLYLYYGWDAVEPVEGEFHWEMFDHSFDTNGSERDDVELENIRHVQVRAGPPFGNLEVAPAWVDTRNITRFKEQYGKYLEEFVGRYRGRVDSYFIFGELSGTAPNQTLEETMEWAVWQTSLIRRLDPSARIFIQTGDMRYFLRPGPAVIHEDGNEITYMPEWMILEALIQADVDFDGIAIESHHGTKDPGDWHQLEERIGNLTSYGREVFVWEIWYPSEYDPELYFDWRSSMELPQNPPYSWPYSPETYTVEWQRDQVVNTMRMLVENPGVTGVSWFVLVDGHHDWGNASSGLLDSDFIAKPSYDGLSNCWWSLFEGGRILTDADGEASFYGMAGEYRLTIKVGEYESHDTIHLGEGRPSTLDIIIAEDPYLCLSAALVPLAFLRRLVQF
jgi:hypothetical protein